METKNYFRTNTVLSYQQARAAILNKGLAATGFLSNWRITDDAYFILSENAKLAETDRPALDVKLVYGPKASTFEVRPGTYIPTDGRAPVQLGGFSVVVRLGDKQTPLTVDFATLSALVLGKEVRAKFADKKNVNDESRPKYKGTEKVVVNLYSDMQSPDTEAFDKLVNQVFDLIDANVKKADTTTKKVTTPIQADEPTGTE